MNLIFAASINDQIREAIADISEALLYPVLIAALITLVMVAYELGRLGVEAWKRSQRPNTPFDQTARQALAQARAGDSAGAQATLKSYSYGDHLQKAAVGTLFAQNALDAQRAVIEYDLYVSKRLDRVRLLVRAGPALGLMGTLIPLAPALSALGKGEPTVLADELQTAFAVTVVGVLVGLVAFIVALVRERYFTRDLTDLEFLRELRGDSAVVGPASIAQPAAATPAHRVATDQPEAASAAAADATVAQTAVSAPAAPAAPSAPVPAPASTPPADAPTPPPAPQVAQAVPGGPPVSVPGQPAFPPPPASEPPKKKFGLKKKAPKVADAPGFPPPPPAATIPPVDEAPKPESDNSTDKSE